MAAASSTPPPVYRKLTRMHRGVGVLTQLWLGRDHLLHVMSTGYTETYRRFYLRDIQSILIVHTARRTYLALALTGPVMIGLAILVSAGAGPAGYGILAAAFLPFFLWNHLLGAGCRVVIITAVQQEKVPALSRLPKTRRILAELRPRIEAAQADLVSTPVAVAVDRPAPVPDETVRSVPPPLPPPLPPP